MTEEEMIRLLWGIYLNACMCNLDWDSLCVCGAADKAASGLEEILGVHWKPECQARFDS